MVKGYPDWTHIILHHSATPDGQTNEWESIWRYHEDEQKWSTIGYNFGIEEVNGILKYKIGRPLNITGGHTKGMNESAIGICLVGNYDVELPTMEKYFKIIGLCKILMEMFGIPKENIKRHSDYAQKTCPGKLFKLDQIVNYL